MRDINKYYINLKRLKQVIKVDVIKKIYIGIETGPKGPGGPKTGLM
jgi:hypothetical protein